MPPSREPWHLDRRVPIALIITLAVQTAGMIWWAAQLSSSVENHDRRIASLEASDLRRGQEAQRVAEALARLDERMVAQTEILRDIRARLDGR